MATKQYDNYADLITFTRASSGTALRRVGYGAELVTNGTFDTDTDWTKVGSTTISGGQATLSALFDVLEQSITISNGDIVRISYEVVSNSNPSGNNLALSSQGFTNSTTFIDNDVGSHTVDVVVVDATKPLRFVLAIAATVVIDNVSVKEVIFDRSTDPLVLFNHPTNVPRIEYDADRNRLGLLIEEARTNLLLYSEVVDGTGWADVGSTSTNLTDDALGVWDGVSIASGGQVFHRLNADDDIAVTTGDVLTFRVWVKAGTSNRLRVNLREFDTVTASRVSGEFGSLSATNNSAGPITSVKEEDWGNGIVAVSGTITVNFTGDLEFSIGPDSAVSGETVIAYAAQVEAGSFATSYIGTSGATATRSADVASIPTSAFGYNSKVGAGGTVIADFQSDKWQYGTAFYRVWEFDGSLNNGLFHASANPNQFRYRLNDSSGNAVLGASTMGAVTATASAGAKIAISYKPNDFAVYANGFQFETDNAGVFASELVTQIGLGGGGFGTSANGHLKSIQYYPRRLTNAQLQRLTA